MPVFKPPTRKINTAKCKYPECTLCIDNCMVKAFDFSAIPPTVNKNCPQCDICLRLCAYDAIELEGGRGTSLETIKYIDMAKCKYPQCTLCLDHCSMNAIDFSQNPPVFKNNCEKDDLCWIICPEGAIIMPNVAETHGRMQMTSADHGFNQDLNIAEKKGKFRRLVPLDKIGWDNPIWKMTKHPRFNIKELYDDDCDEINGKKI